MTLKIRENNFTNPPLTCYREFDWNDKGNITSWFTFDMTLAELKTLKLKQVHKISGIYILQNTMVGVGGMAGWGKN